MRATSLQKLPEISYSAADKCIGGRTVVPRVTVATSARKGIHAARPSLMTDFLTLLRRDHHDLETDLDELLRTTTVAEIRCTLDGVRLGLVAHAEAEDIVLYAALVQAGSPALLDDLIGGVRNAHLVQEGALAALVSSTPGTSQWRDRAVRLRDLVHEHAAYEENAVLPAIRDHAPAVYKSLAGSFATERLRQLAMLQPSLPIFVSELAQAQG